jgi:uncharacterized protein
MARGSFFTTVKLGPKRSLTPEKFLLCEEVPIARTGMMIYGPNETPIKAGPDGIVKIFREPEEVFRAETLASAQGKSVAIDHPDDDIVPENWKELSHGVMINPRRGQGAADDLMYADLLITTMEGIAAIDKGQDEISLGYDADYEEVSPGVGRQSNIIINHVALVNQGRCGTRCSIGDSNTIGEAQMKMKDYLMRAFKAKDAAEVEELAKEATKDDITGGEGAVGGEGTHVHVHMAGEPESGGATAGGTGEPGRGRFTDDDIQEHMDSNAAEHAEMNARIQALEELVAKLAGGKASETGDDEGETEASATEIEGALKEEAPPGTNDEELKKTKDSRFLVDSFQDTVAMAEILAPGIKIPTFDAAASPVKSFKRICAFRRSALDTAYTNPATRLIIADLVGGRTLDTKNMTCDAVRTLFRSAATVKRSQNNTARTSTADTKAKPAPMTLAEINRRNAERYKN